VNTSEWDGLRVGDRVLVHDDLSTGEDFPLYSGVVVTVDRTTRSHAVGIRVADICGAETPVLRLLRTQVHRDPCDRSEPCWRCDWAKRKRVVEPQSTANREMEQVSGRRPIAPPR
jgi:hypothetical protein